LSENPTEVGREILERLLAEEEEKAVVPEELDRK
jgi:hypothetical protein